MPYATKDYNAILADMRQEMANLDPSLSLQDDDDEIIRAKAVAVAVEGSYQGQQFILRQMFPQTAEAEWLEYHADRSGLSRKPASHASGDIRITGNEGATLAAGSAVSFGSLTYATTTEVAIGGSGEATVPVLATTAGPDGNLAADTPVTLTSPPAGIDTAAVVVTLSGGAAEESDDSLRARVLYTLRNPPGTGTVADYLRWATAVDGVGTVLVYPRRRGLGTVDVCITSADDGIPGSPLLAAVQAAIDTNKPEPADSLVIAPTLLTVAISVHLALSGITLLTVTPLVESLCADYFDTLRPGDPVVVSQLASRFLSIGGVTDVQMVAPVVNVTPEASELVVEWCALGAVTVGVMS